MRRKYRIRDTTVKLLRRALNTYHYYDFPSLYDKKNDRGELHDIELAAVYIRWSWRGSIFRWKPLCGTFRYRPPKLTLEISDSSLQ